MISLPDNFSANSQSGDKTSLEWYINFGADCCRHVVYIIGCILCCSNNEIKCIL